MRSYPDEPGYKARETSIIAAESSKIHASHLRDKVRSLFGDHRNLTADEVADLLNVSILSVRPRCSELAALGFIVDSGERRPNASGKRAIAWTQAKSQIEMFQP